MFDFWNLWRVNLKSCDSLIGWTEALSKLMIFFSRQTLIIWKATTEGDSGECVLLEQILNEKNITEKQNPHAVILWEVYFKRGYCSTVTLHRPSPRLAQCPVCTLWITCKYWRCSTALQAIRSLGPGDVFAALLGTLLHIVRFSA